MAPDRYYTGLWKDGPRQVTGHVNLLHNDIAVAAILWPDWSFVRLAGQGATIIGKIPHAGIYREADVVPEITRDELLTTNDDWIRSIEQGPTPLPDQANVI